MLDHILSILIFFPALAAVLGFAVNKNSIRSYGVAVATIEFVLALWLWFAFDSSVSGMQFMEHIPLVKAFGINYIVGVDGISLFIIILAAFFTMIGIASLGETKDIKNMIVTLLFLQMTMVGVFAALDAIVFYLFWELSLVPMLYIIGAWGGPLRIYASVKFFLYTFTGSLVMLVGMLFMAYFYYQATGEWSFAILDWYRLILPETFQKWLFVAFFFGFAIKVPMFPFHTWLPYAHGQAPTIGSVILAAILLKMGTYAFIRFSLPLFPDASVYFMYPIAVLAIIMIIYTAMVAYAQKDIKQVVAYSSVSHMGVIILGIFALNVEGITGSIFLMIAHGVVSGALFFLVGVIYDRRHTKYMSEFGGLASVMPRYATIFGIMLMASVGLPLTINFVGEFLSLLGFYKQSHTLTLLAGMAIIVGAIYMLSAYKKMFFGVVTKDENRNLPDVNKRELVALIPLTIITIWLGIYPKVLLEPINTSVEAVVGLMHEKSLTQEAKSRIPNLTKDAEVITNSAENTVENSTENSAEEAH
ncbi:MAG: NADH-quinone oxidoreductase subunit M [Sulfurimonas sp. RIFCSPHIGHO2_12_FULL_36_9]|uniref:NADH-quinone oxidoreductase subunit M n=1 Tax=Sulfurimonas sp. RIFCSPLOWO2_12_36_12 TaxID=1802253 RepID=UPI0008C9A823|nr:NADH-quinone oxidoreductase subunit M [Sulfurimonas sp. RIFCSPLOWO2_12_36_12]OHD99673.1 MAG: NADH-quinone oxidoreductase subunit M [Sulfurimonas sp. RIFCSPLOWO2_02_FULL_36_28]OHD99884.1 MAG: NADH-quinone oxidoreductase subunit M [Sulfurimonas sp. RIFCSPHIGHO2_12_FULL_36_9]OHE01298.1 MAG: NADH-quinone oxidoreductase subunit M [Sulfurimonas sp. RIFCSPLOWO2_12_36_12]OHE07317.1 MAG: NADH-quinone oxidoreductase subunit M [Sulfurimonas sp. RIFCSPLOWO2_12_FULL_36_74]